MNLNYLLEKKGFEEIDYKCFYRDVFPVGAFERKCMYEDHKPNGVIVEVTNEKINGRQKILRHTLTDDLEKLDEVVQRDNFCIMSPISYIGKSRKSQNARLLYAIAIDLDGVTTEKGFDFLMEQIEHGDIMQKFVWGLPRPTYIVSSGTGLHLYYVFVQPIPLFRNIVEGLEKLKRRLTWQAWTQGASDLHDNVQYESLYQGFRVVGTITKNGSRARAYKIGNKITVDYLNDFVPEDYQAKDFIYQSNLTLEEAKKKYPGWYEKRIVQNKPKGTWTCHEGLYKWWIEKMKDGATQGHRYWCVMTLATYAKKCNIPYERLFKDSVGMLDLLNSKGDEFTTDDILHALEAYNDSYMTYPIDTIVNRTDIPIEKNKRNYRKQSVHVKYMNMQREFKVELGECTNGGRPKGKSKQKDIVEEWQHNNPQGRKADCIRDTGLAKSTVYKWWND